MKSYLFLIFYGVASFAFAQKPVLDTSLFNTWTSVDAPVISGNGKYMTYTHSEGMVRKRIIQSSDLKWKIEIPFFPRSNSNSAESVGPAFCFAKDNQKCVFAQDFSDTICILTLPSSSKEFITNVRKYRLSNTWMIYTQNHDQSQLFMRNLTTGRHITLSNIQEFQFVPSEKKLILFRTIESKDSLINQVSMFRMDSFEENIIWTGTEVPNNFVVDNSETRIAFHTREEGVDGSRISLRVFRVDAPRFITLIDNVYFKVSDDPPKFTMDGRTILFSMRDSAVRIVSKKDTNVKLNLLNSMDDSPSEQTSVRTFLAAKTEGIDTLVYLSKPTEEVLEFESGLCGEYVLVKNKFVDFSESNWKPRPKIFLVSVRSGERRLISNAYVGLVDISPDQKHVIFYNYDVKNFFCYDISTGTASNLTEGLKVAFSDEDDDHPQPPRCYMLNYTWVDRESRVILYDKYDIWKFDLSGGNRPVCITNGFGRKSKIIFRLTFEQNKFHQNQLSRNFALLTATNILTKDNGFYKVDVSLSDDPTVLSIGAYLYSLPRVAPEVFFEERIFTPIKATNAPIYIVRRESSSQAPNFFLTRDFKSFDDLTGQYPERNYNWLSSELITWSLPGGSKAEGLLYKPQNFDPKKKYPVIFLLYEKVTHVLNKYYFPGFSNGPINIPYFVSNGYLVVRPNIYYTPGHTAEGVCNSVISSAQYLLTLPFVDSSKMGLSGHSFGGYEVNYLVTATNLFAAASSAAAVSNLVSFYTHDPYINEVHQVRIGAVPWRAPRKFVTNSPFFYVNRVQTPLLIMQGGKDGRVPPEQALTFHKALRREGKQSWLLLYENAHHQVTGADEIDYSRRLNEFFDFYLKNKPQPKWMKAEN
jgi:dienelactone hydrolase